eukprot:7703239-Pyramimonas_sp.AAC.1
MRILLGSASARGSWGGPGWPGSGWRRGGGTGALQPRRPGPTPWALAGPAWRRASWRSRA